MLSIQQIHAAAAAEVATTALIINLHPDSNFILISAIDSPPVGIHLDGNQKYKSYQVTSNEVYRGVVTTDFDVEVDEISAFYAVGKDVKGAIIYENGMISISSSFSGRDNQFPIIRTFSSKMKLGFSRWSIVAGPLHKRQTLVDIDVSSQLERYR